MHSDARSGVLDYQNSSRPGRGRSTWLADVSLSAAFVLYLFVNLACTSHSPDGPFPFGALLAFAIPLPLVFIASTVLAHFLVRPRLFDRWIMTAVVLLLAATAAGNYYLLCVTANRVT